MDRSTFIRWAISAELRRLGIEFDDAHVFPPDRAGKGGRKKKVAYLASDAGPLPVAAEKPKHPYTTKKGRHHEDQEREE